MGRCRNTLPHIAFFEALAEMTEGSPDWQSTSAGLVTLRLFDAWVDVGPRIVATNSFGITAVRKTIGEIETHHTLRALLQGIVDAMASARKVARLPVVIPRLMAYARALQFEGKWSLAADVYKTVLDHVHYTSDTETAITAGLSLGACFRMLADWDEALLAYRTAEAVARDTGDIMNVLKARISEANVVIDLGNLPKAEVMLDEVVEKAAEHGLANIRAWALQDRGIVARRRGNLSTAITYTYEALISFEDQAKRDRALVDLAALFYDLGLRSAARDAHLVLAATAQEQYTRWVATINLLEIAAQDRCEPAFEQYGRELADADLPAALAAHYHLYVGRGYCLFGKYEQAKAALERALAVATHNHVNEIIIKAEEALVELRAGRPVIGADERKAVASEPSPTVSKVATAVHDMLVTAGAGQ